MTSPGRRVTSCRWHVLQVAGLIACLQGCHGPDQELAWDVGESRTVYESGSALPDTTPSEGDFYAFAPLGLQRFRLALVARSSLAIGARATIVESAGSSQSTAYAAVAAMGPMVIGPLADVGSAYAYTDTPLSIEDGARVHGYVKSVAGVRLAPDASVDVGILQRVPGPVEAFHWQLPPRTASLGDRTSSYGGDPLELGPGVYGTVSVPSGSRLRIQGGHYDFEAFRLEVGGELDIDNTAAPVFLWVRHELVLSGSMVDDWLGANVLIGYSGSSPPSLRAGIRATLIAPAATLTIPATIEPHVGSFFADKIVVEDGAKIELHGFDLVRWPRLEVKRACDLCDEEAGRAREACCRGGYRLMSSISMSAQRCQRDIATRYADCLSAFRYGVGACSNRGYRDPSRDLCVR